MRNETTRFLILAALFTGLTAAAAQLSFVLPALSKVPFTLQVLAVALTGALLPPRWAAGAMAAYVLLGALGAPVYANGKAGLGVLLGPTGGYLFAYPVAAFVIALLSGPGLRRLFLATLAGLTLIYAGGAGWAMTLGGVQAATVWSGWVLPFIPYDLVKIALASVLALRVRGAIQLESRTRAA